MEYKVGSYIPESEILRQFADEDGEIFLEIRGMEDTLYRVNKENQICYQIDKSLLVGEDLTLVKDFSPTKPESEPEPEPESEPDLEFQYQLEEHWRIPGEDSQTDIVMEETVTGGSRTDSLKLLDFLKEGRQVPEKLKHLCERRIYGGYSLRYNNFLYTLNSNYIIVDKTQELELDYQMEDEKDVLDLEKMGIPVIPENNRKKQPEKIELQEGDVLPSHLRDHCKQRLSTEGGSRIIIGDYLYILDKQYIVTSKIKLSCFDDEEIEVPLMFPDTSKPGKRKIPKKKLPVEEIITNVVKTFEIGLEKYKISADFFKDTVLDPDRREVLTRVFHGDLTQLNDDIREACVEGKTTVLKKKGFTLVKAALVHELYINSSVAGRGENMKGFLTHIIAAEPDGTLGELQGDISLEGQKEVLDFFGRRAEVYTDKAEIIKRIRRHLRANIFKEYEELRKAGQEVRFNAYLIMKLYQHTTRLDRGDGITMIRLTRDLLDYNNS